MIKVLSELVIKQIYPDLYELVFLDNFYSV